MKLTLFSLVMLGFFSVAQAQNTDTTVSHKAKFYVGVGVSGMSYPIYYQSANAAGTVISDRFRPVSLNLGYNLSQRATLQVGLAYGSDKETPQWIIGSGQADKRKESKTRAFAVPVTLRMIVGNTNARLPVYATLTLLPIWGTTTINLQERNNDIITNTSTIQKEGINTFATGGIGFNYKILKRFTGYGEMLFVRSNLSGSSYRYYTKLPRILTFTYAVGTGINYNF